MISKLLKQIKRIPDSAWQVKIMLENSANDLRKAERQGTITTKEFQDQYYRLQKQVADVLGRFALEVPKERRKAVEPIKGWYEASPELLGQLIDQAKYHVRTIHGPRVLEWGTARQEFLAEDGLTYELDAIFAVWLGPIEPRSLTKK